MTQFILLIYDNMKTASTAEEWDSFFESAGQSGVFRGGSEIGEREIIGHHRTAKPSDHIVGYMRFDSGDKQTVLELLEKHPVVMHGGSVELCVLPKS